MTLIAKLTKFIRTIMEAIMASKVQLLADLAALKAKAQQEKDQATAVIAAKNAQIADLQTQLAAAQADAVPQSALDEIAAIDQIVTGIIP